MTCAVYVLRYSSTVVCCHCCCIRAAAVAAELVYVLRVAALKAVAVALGVAVY
jgi:hypothetical protein